jgi:hypothetical protein
LGPRGPVGEGEREELVKVSQKNTGWWFGTWLIHGY